MGENIRYRVKFHGHYTAIIPQREGHTQGSLSSPKKCNLLGGAFAEELERRQLGVKVGGKTILGAAWSDDTPVLAQRPRAQYSITNVAEATAKLRLQVQGSKLYSVLIARGGKAWAEPGEAKDGDESDQKCEHGGWMVESGKFKIAEGAS